MKKVEFSVLASNSLEELRVILNKARVELLESRMSIKTGRQKNVSEYILKKKFVAQVLTAIRQKNLK